MSRANVGAAVRRLCGSLAAGRDAEIPDRALLQRFLSARDEAAFAALVRRHGGLVLGVCRRVLHRQQDAEDVFQATFLLLARKAASIRRDALGCWLYRVAYRLALKARAQLDRRRRSEAQAAPPPAADPLADVSWHEAQALLDEELARLPEKYRAPLLLCYFEGQTQDEAARQLGWCKRTLKARLSRGRELLRSRLTRRGLPLGSALFAAMLSRGEVLAAPLVEAVCRAAAQSGAAASAGATALVRGALREIALARCRAAAAVVLACGLLVGGGMLLSGGEESPRQPAPQVQPKPEAGPPRDAHGDPLPAVAALRLGTERWRHGGTVGALVWSPDGKWLASGGGFSDWAVRFWDPGTGKELRSFGEHPAAIKALAVSRDGKRMASADRHGQLLLWPAVGRGERTPLQCNPDGLSLAFAPDGKALAAVHPDGGPVLYDVKSGAEVRAFGRKLAQRAPTRALALSPDGKTLATADANKAVHLWEAATGKPLHTLAHNAFVDCLAFSPDGKRLACGGRGETVRLWDVAGGKTVQFFKGHNGPITALSWSPDGTTIASAGGDATVRLWDLKAGRERLCFTGHHSPVSAVAFSPDGKRVASAAGGREHTVRVWDAATGAEPAGPEGHRSWVGWQALLPGGRTLLTAGADRTARLWDVRSGKPLGTLATGQVRAKAFALSPDSKLAAAGCPDGTIRLVEVPSGKSVRVLKAGDGAVWSVVFTPDGKRLISGGPDKQLRIWDVASGEPRGALGGAGEVNWSFAFSPDGKLLATGGDGGAVWLWVFEGQKVRSWPLGSHAGGVEQLLFTADGARLISAGDDGALLLWDVSGVRDGRPAVKVEAPAFARQAALVYAAAVSPDGRTLATGTSDRRVTLWEAATGKPRATLEGHRGAVASLLFLPGGRRLVSGSSDGTALVWELGRLASDTGASLTEERLAALWRDLAGGEAQASYRALWALAAHPREALARLKAEVAPVVRVEAAQVARWVGELGDKRFATREKAMAELHKAGEGAWPALRAALKDPPSLEVAGRLRMLLAEDSPVPTAGRLRRMRALELLELLGTPEARRYLEALAGGAPGAWLTREAQTALRRVAR